MQIPGLPEIPESLQCRVCRTHILLQSMRYPYCLVCFNNRGKTGTPEPACEVCGEKGWVLEHNEDDDRWECSNCQLPTDNDE